MLCGAWWLQLRTSSRDGLSDVRIEILSTVRGFVCVVAIGRFFSFLSFLSWRRWQQRVGWVILRSWPTEDQDDGRDKWSRPPVATMDFLIFLIFYPMVFFFSLLFILFYSSLFIGFYSLYSSYFRSAWLHCIDRRSLSLCARESRYLCPVHELDGTKRVRLGVGIARSGRLSGVSSTGLKYPTTLRWGNPSHFLFPRPPDLRKHTSFHVSFTLHPFSLHHFRLLFYHLFGRPWPLPPPFSHTPFRPYGVTRANYWFGPFCQLRDNPEGKWGGGEPSHSSSSQNEDPI